MKGISMRGASTDLGTPGVLTLENGWSCDMLELPWYQNARGISCVKAGAYVGRLFFSPHLNRYVLKFDDKNGRGDVECHPGNFAGDTSKGHTTQTGATVQNFTQVHGCMLPGTGYGDILLPNRTDGAVQWGIKNSSVTLNRLLTQLGVTAKTPAGQVLLELEIEWESAVWPEDDV